MSGIANFLVGMGNGYMVSSQKTEDRKRQQTNDDLRNNLLRMQTEGAQIDLDNKRAIATAGQDRAPVLNEPGDGMGPSAVVVGKNGMDGVRAFAPMQTQEAQTYADTQNTPASKEGRTVSAMMQSDPLKAQSYKQNAVEFARKLEQEGMIDLNRDNLIDAPSVEDIERGKVKLSPLNGAEKFNAIGKIKVPEGAQRQWFTQDLGNGRKVQDYRVVGSKGELLSGGFTGRALDGLFGMTAKERETLADGRAEKATDNKNKDRQLKVMEAGSVADINYKNASTAAVGVKVPDVPKAVEMQNKNMGEQIKTLEQKLDPTPDDIQNIAALRLQQRKLISQYMPSGGATPDPMGKRGGNQPAAKAAGALSTFASTPDEMNISMALSNELEAASAKLSKHQQGTDEWRRAKGDVDSVLSEMKRNGIQQRTSSTQPAAAPAAGTTKPAKMPEQAPAPKAKPTTAQILSQPVRGNALLEQMESKRAAPIDAALGAFNQLNAQFQAAAKSGDVRAIQAMGAKLTAARTSLDALMKDLPEQTKAAILATASN